jgi:cyclopropane fatty-acyl-phospholipid synthase-like methyltransferase
MDGYNAYGLAAKRLDSPTLISGRRCFQADAEANIVKDVISKLRIEKAHRLLEIGCGVGVLLTPLSKQVAEGVGIDHPACLDKYRALGVPANVTLVAGQWPRVELDGLFDRVLIYSVLHYMPGPEEARAFILAAIDSLRPGGRLLIGDIPNRDSRERFMSTDDGKRCHAEWVERNARTKANHIESDSILSQIDNHSGFLNDSFILALLADMRRDGLEAYVLPQLLGLPFCYTREDVLIWKRD